MIPLKRPVDDYLALRRSLGFKLSGIRPVQRHDFVSFLGKNGSARKSPISSPWSMRLTAKMRSPFRGHVGSAIIRGFARYRIGADPKTEFPSVGLLKFRSQAGRPYLYSEDEIRRLLGSGDEDETLVMSWSGIHIIACSGSWLLLVCVPW